ncbi:CBS domain-containing protein CBSX3, mitochondrial, partial [Linum perenne]
DSPSYPSAHWKNIPQAAAELPLKTHHLSFSSSSDLLPVGFLYLSTSSLSSSTSLLHLPPALICSVDQSSVTSAFTVANKTMQGAIGAFFSKAGVVKTTLLQHVRVLNPALRPLVFSRSESVSSAARIEEHGFEHTTISDVLSAKGKGADGSWLWCTTDDTVHDAVHSMTQHNVGALVVVKPGEQKSIAGIITERENRIRHIPVIDDKGMIGMVSIGDVVRAVVSEHREELDRLNAFIQGGY